MAELKSRPLGGGSGADQGMVVLSLGPFDANSVDATVFVADKPYRVLSVEEVHSVAGDDSGDVLMQVAKCTGTLAPQSGTDLLFAAISLKATANTVQSATLITTDASLELADGDRLAVHFGGYTLTTLAGCNVTVVLIPIPDTLNWISR